MHFHRRAICMHCANRRLFECEIPNILVVSEMCQFCGWNDLVGMDGEQTCYSCRVMWADDVERAQHWGRHSRA